MQVFASVCTDSYVLNINYDLISVFSLTGNRRERNDCWWESRRRTETNGKKPARWTRTRRRENWRRDQLTNRRNVQVVLTCLDRRTEPISVCFGDDSLLFPDSFLFASTSCSLLFMFLSDCESRLQYQTTLHSFFVTCNASPFII